MSKIGSVAKSSEGIEELRSAFGLTGAKYVLLVKRFSKISKCAVAPSGSEL